MAGINDYGDTGDALSSPPLGGPGGWAESVSAVLNGSDETVDARVADAVNAHSVDTTDVHGIPDTADLTTSAELEAYAAARATVGNLLTDNQASGTDTLGTTEGWGSPYQCTYASSTSSPIQGTRSLVLTATGANPTLYGYPLTTCVPVVAGTPFTALAEFQTQTGSTVAPRIQIRFYDGAGANLGQTIVDGVAVPGNQTLSVTAVAPPTAEYATPVVGGSLATVGDTVKVDRISVHSGAGGNWAMPGVPITGLGTRITRPNVDDRLVEQWNGSAWSGVDYDSGARNYTGVSAGILRRSGNAVQWTGTGGVPIGFGDTYNTGDQFYMTNDGVPTSLPGTLVTPAPQ